MAAWSLSNARGCWLAGKVFAGYMLGVLPLVGLTDRLASRSIYLACSVLNALSCFGVALSDDWRLALVFRAAAGVALAGMYMPGLRALTDGVDGVARARIAAVYTSAFTVGTSLSFLSARVGVPFDWRGAFVLAGLLGTAGTLIAWAALPRAALPHATVPHATVPRAVPGASARARLLPDLRPVFGNRDAMVLVCLYAATIWGSAGVRQWIVVFLAFCAAGQGPGAAPAWSMLATGALINLLGVPAGLLGNELALRFGLQRIAMLVFVLSMLVSVLFGYVAWLPYPVVLVLSLLTGFIVQGNFANLTSGVLIVADPDHRGATVALYSCVGFGGGFLGTLLFGITLDATGGAARLTAWAMAFASCGIGCFAGGVATCLLSRDVGRTRV
jgi:predicted MFS family arabinose efflux permease